LTTGVISKVEKDTITSDSRSNPGNSGGPLFTLERAGGRNYDPRDWHAGFDRPDSGGAALIEQARKNMAGTTPPDTKLLPWRPVDHFPAMR